MMEEISLACGHIHLQYGPDSIYNVLIQNNNNNMFIECPIIYLSIEADRRTGHGFEPHPLLKLLKLLKFGRKRRHIILSGSDRFDFGQRDWYGLTVPQVVFTPSSI